MTKYTKTPIEAAQAKNINLRSPHTVEVHWNYFPLKGRKYRAYLNLKAHIETQIKWLAILDTNELYRIKLAIDAGDVPVFFKPIIDEIYATKQRGKHVVEITIGDNASDFPIFEYATDESLNNPLVPTDATTKSGPVEVMLPKSKIAPKPPFQQIPPSVARILAEQKRKKG